MPADDSLKDFLRDVIEDHDAGASSADAQTITSIASAKMSGLGVLPGHEVEHLIARGGMGAVYLARQHALEREVAVKVMTADAESPEMAVRFRREALVLGKLAHPNIVPVYDVGTDDEGQLFYTMKLVKGRTLQHILNDLREQNAEALRAHTLASLLTVFRKVCDAVAFAHSQGIIHRDLKPENVMVGEFGEVLVMDWGLAKRQNDEASEADPPHSSFTAPAGASSLHTLQGAVLGTPQYMSPEQARGEIDELDERSDVFSLGGILYAILTLRAPVEGGTVNEILEKVRTASIEPPSTAVTKVGATGATTAGGAVPVKKISHALPHIAGGKVPAALASVVMKALRAEKARRYQSVAEFSADIEAYQGGFATSAEQAGAWRQIVLLTKRHKAVAASLAVLMLVSIGFVLKVMASERKATRNAEVAMENEKAARRALAKSALSLAEAAQREGNGVVMQAALAEVPEDLRDSTWNYLLGQSDTSLASLRGNSGIIPLPTIDGIAADPSRPGVFAVAGADFRVRLVDVRSARLLLEFTPEFKTEAPKDATLWVSLAFFPDGERIAVGRSGKSRGIVFHSTRDGKKLAEWDALSTSRLAFSPDGKLLLQNIGQSSKHWWHLAMWDVTSGRVLWEYAENEKVSPQTAEFTADGEKVLTTGPPRELRLLNARDGNVVQSFPDPSIPFAGINVFRRILGANGLIAQSLTDDTVVVSDMQTGKLVTRFQQPKGMWGSRSLVFTPDGEQLVTTMSMPDGREALNLWNARTGFLVRSLLGGRSRNLGMAVHPLSGEILVCGDYPRAWDLTGARPKWEVPKVAAGDLIFFGDDDTVIASGGIFALSPGGAGISALRIAGGKGMAGTYQNPSVSADGHWAAIPSGSGPGAVRILHQRDGLKEEKPGLNGPQGQWNGSRCRLSPEGKQVVVYWTTQNETPLHWYSCITGEVAGEIECQKITQVHDLGWLAADHLIGLTTTNGLRTSKDSEEHIVLWDMTSGKILRMAAHTTEMDVLAISPDGTRFAEAGADKNVRIRDAETLDVLKEFRAHDGPIIRLAWHPSKPILATTATDWSYRLWNVDTGEMLEEMRGPLSPATSLAFSPTGRRLGTTDSSGTLRIWEPESLNDPPAQSR